MLDPIAYTYEADTHCPECARKRFGQDELGFPPADAKDGEGNGVGAIAPWDEWYDAGSDEAQTLVCGTCGTEIDTFHNGF